MMAYLPSPAHSAHVRSYYRWLCAHAVRSYHAACERRVQEYWLDLSLRLELDAFAARQESRSDGAAFAVDESDLGRPLTLACYALQADARAPITCARCYSRTEEATGDLCPECHDEELGVVR